MTALLLGHAGICVIAITASVLMNLYILLEYHIVFMYFDHDISYCLYSWSTFYHYHNCSFKRFTSVCICACVCLCMRVCLCVFSVYIRMHLCICGCVDVLVHM